MIKDSTTARSPATAMRDLLRFLERQTITPPARPNNPPALLAAPPAARSAPPAGLQSNEQAAIRIGAWVLAEDALSGDLVATHADGTTRTVATRGDL